MKSSFTSRSAKLMGLAAKVGGHELTRAIKQRASEALSRGLDEIASDRLKTRIEQARLIAEQLSQLKGAAMKAGQLLSLDPSDFIPPEAVEILSRLQGKADPVDWSVMRQVLVEDLGEEKVRRFSDLQTQAAASASIGQVHRAKLDGRDVAIKIQYPGIADSIDSDLKILRTLAQSFVSLAGKHINLEETFTELAGVLHQEADYVVELAHLREYRSHLLQDDDFSVPEPFDALSSRRVLTMSWELGLHLSDWMKTSPAVADRKRVAHLLLDLYCREFFEWGLVQTDPNYANFLVRQDTPNAPIRLVVLDFGATLRYSIEFRRDYVELLKTMATRDRAQIKTAFVEFGLVDPRESDESFELLADMILTSLEPFRPEKQPFNFTDEDFSRRSRETTRRFSQSLRYSPPPKQIIFLHRKLGGVFTFVKKLGVEIDLTPYWQKMVGAEIK